jgi:hypothetical protein
VALGAAVRGLVGPRWAHRLGRCYRAIFVDLTKEAAALASVIPPDAHLLDVGGGDGEPLNHLLALRRDLRITTLDPGPLVGQWIEERFADRVVRLPRTSLADYLEHSRDAPDALVMADVMHHIPEDARPAFLASVRELLERAPRLRIIVKDVEPGHWRALLGYWSDRYVTGDRRVSPISRERLTRLFAAELGRLQCEDTALFEVDRPNYALVFFR